MNATHFPIFPVIPANDTLSQADILANVARSAGTGMGQTTVVEIVVHPITGWTQAIVTGPANLLGAAKKRMLNALRIASAPNLGHVVRLGKRTFVHHSEPAMGVQWHASGERAAVAS